MSSCKFEMHFVSKLESGDFVKAFFFSLLMVAAGLPASGQTPPNKPADAGITNVEVDPIRCWWRTSSGSVRIGEHFDLWLTCAALETDAFGKHLRETLLDTFRPAFLARMTTVPYRMLDDAMLRAIIEQKLEQLRTRYREATGKQFAFDAGIIDAMLSRCRAAGAREIDNVLMNELVGTLAQWALE